MRCFEPVARKYRKNKVEPKLPTRSTANSAAYDIYSPVNITIQPMETGFLWTDIKAWMEPDEALLINVRSSMGKQPIMIANTQGWIDSDYYSNPDNDGNIGFRLLNLGKTPYEIKVGDRIGQGMFVKYLTACGDDTRTKRMGGFGSTGL